MEQLTNSLTNVNDPPPAAPTDLFPHHFMALADALPQIVWLDDAAGKTQYVNRHWVQYAGLTAAESLGQGMRQAIHQADLPAAHVIWADPARDALSYECELRLRGADGQYRWHLCRSSQMRNPAGELIGWFGTAHDIDEHKRATERLRFQANLRNATAREEAEAALRDSEERFRVTFEQAAVGMAHVGLDGRWLAVNNRLCEILGYSREALLNLSFQELTHPDDLTRDVAVLQKLVANEIDGYQVEKRYIRQDGSIVWTTITVSTQRDPLTRQLQYFISVVEDISARKQADIQLKIIAEASRVLSTSRSPAQRVQAVAELLVPELAEWCLVNLLHAPDQLELAAIAHQDPAQIAQMRSLAHQWPLSMTGDSGTPFVIRSGRSFFLPELTHDTIVHNARLGRLKPFGPKSMIIVPLQARGQTLGAMTLIRGDGAHPFVEADLTFAEELGRRMGLAVDNARLYEEARDAEAKFRQLSETLEQRVAERTAELERSNRDLDQFAYVASHDLKAPLRAIENLSVWIEEDAEGALPSPVQDHLAKLRNRVQRMERLLDDLLAYSRAGRIQHPPELLEIDGLIKGVLELHSIPLDFRVTVDQTAATIYTAHVPLETVLRNLIGNAIKHHDRADGHVHIRITEQAEALQICVEDDGPGIAPQFHQRIFEMFQTLQPRDEREGSGIGLTIVKKLVEHVGGRIWLESSEGRGARFCFTWPKSLPTTEPTAAASADGPT